jgi:hypothetical protein
MTEQEYLTHIENCVSEIRSIDMSNGWAYEQVVHSILKIEKLPIILFKYPKDAFIYRARINNDKNLFQNVSDISSPEKKDVRYYGRANKPRQVLFYGSETRPVSYLEFTSHLSETVPIGDEAMITIGAWQLLKEMQLVLVYNPALPRDNAYNKYHGQGFDDFISNIPKELRKGTTRFFEFIGEEYAKIADDNDESYYITCAYSNIILGHKSCDGIMYPSVPLGGEGFNVAIKEKIYKEGYLKLDSVMVDRFIAKAQENGKHNFVNNANRHASAISEKTITWEDNWKTF